VTWTGKAGGETGVRGDVAESFLSPH
jgi:hypothetical protein